MTNDSLDRPALTDVVITSVMVEAGADAFRASHCEVDLWGDEKEAVTAIFVAMLQAAGLSPSFPDAQACGLQTR